MPHSTQAQADAEAELGWQRLMPQLHGSSMATISGRGLAALACLQDVSGSQAGLAFQKAQGEVMVALLAG